MPFELWRQDDNGHRFRVGRDLTLDEAERQLAELSRTPHKQIYWIADSVQAEDVKRGDD